MEDAALIAKAQRGDSVALSRLLQAHYLPVKKYLITIAMNRALAEDLTQETMIRAIQRIGQFGGRSRFSTWLMTIATNLYTDTMRRHQLERRYQAEHALEIDPPADNVSRTEWQDMMQRLAALPRDVAIPVVLKHYYGYTQEEIAHMMGIPEGTVKSRIFNGIRTLRKGLAEDDTE